MARKLSWRRRLLFIGLTVAIVGVCVEVGLQAYYFVSAGDFLFRRVAPPIFREDPTRCYGLKPDLEYTHHTNEFRTEIYTNSRGFRTDSDRKEVDYSKPADVYRVLFLGPSFTFGWGSDYEDTYVALIGEGLSVPGKRVEVINLGTPSQGSAHQLCWLQEEGYKYDPDLVVTTSYGSGVANVVGECPESLRCPVIEDGRLYTRRPTFKLRAITAVKKFATVFYGYYLYQTLTAAEPPKGAGVGKELYTREELEVAPDEIDALADSFERYVKFVQATVDDRTQVVFIHIPLSFMVHPKDWSRWSHLTDIDPPTALANTRAGIAAVQQRGVEIVDTTQALTEAGREERMYYWLDIHLTPAGNRVVARTALPLIQRIAVRDVSSESDSDPED